MFVTQGHGTDTVTGSRKTLGGGVIVLDTRGLHIKSCLFFCHFRYCYLAMIIPNWFLLKFLFPFETCVSGVRVSVAHDGASSCLNSYVFDISSLTILPYVCRYLSPRHFQSSENKRKRPYLLLRINKSKNSRAAFLVQSEGFRSLTLATLYVHRQA